MIPLDEARRHVLDRVEPLPPRAHVSDDAVGCVLAADVRARSDVPPFANTAMDGFAVRTVDVAAAPAVLEVVGTVGAGHVASAAIGAGQAMRIFTGAPVPAGADAVVMVERTRALDGGARVEVHEAVPPGMHIRPAGDDVTAGDVVLRAGDLVTPAHAGVLASIDVTEVAAHPRPRVGVLSTGDELVEPPRPLGPGQIRDSNRRALLALVAASGFSPVDLGLVGDDEAAITAVLRAAPASCDAVLTTGGVSMGDVDLVKVVLDRIGDMRWMQIAIRPAKPFAFGVLPGHGRPLPVFGLPGNPVSSLVSFEVLARPALRRMAGHGDGRLDRPVVTAVADEALARRPDGKLHLVRVVASHDGSAVHVRSAGGQGSHQLAAMAHANALALLPDGDGVPAGGAVRVLLTGDLVAPGL